MNDTFKPRRKPRQLLMVSLLLLPMAGLFFFLYSRTKAAGDFTSDNFSWPGLGSFSLGFTGISGNGDLKSESRNLTAYTAISSSGSIDVKWSPGPTTSAAVEAQENLLPHIKTEVVGDTLKIYSDCSYSTNKPVTVTLVSPDLNRINLSGSGNFTGTFIDGENLDLYASGSGEVHIDGKAHNIKAHLSGAGDLTATLLEAKTLDASLAGSSDFHLHGIADHFMLSIAGSGDVDAADLKTLSTEITIAGSGDAQLNASDTLSATIYGSGSVTYLGNPPHLTKKILGSGSIQSK